MADLPEKASHSSRFWLLFTIVVILIIVPFILWGNWFELMFNLQGAKRWMEGLGPWAWAGGVGLLISDLFLPVPGTVVMSALGLVYGWFWGGVASVVGSFLSGIVAYGLCRWFGRGPARWLAGDRGLARGESLFHSGQGGWIVAMSRWMPVLPEAVACLAGLVKMPWKTFAIALLAGTVPLGFAFAAIGASGVDNPGAAVILSAVLPVLFYAVAAWKVGKR